MKTRLISLSALMLAGGVSFSLPTLAQQDQVQQDQVQRQNPTQQQDRAQQQDQAQQQKQTKQKDRKISLAVGHNVVDAVDDLRETTADLIGAMLEADEGLGLANWEQKEAQLKQMERNLQQMERTLDQKAEATDSSWLNWLEDPDYSVTVKEQISALGNHLSQIGSMLKEVSQKPGLQVVIGHNIVDQVDDVRETTGDLLNAINDAGPGWGWFNDRNLFQGSLAQLDDMEKTLDKKAEMTDDEWQVFVTSPEYSTTVHRQVNTLADIINGVANRITTEDMVTQVNN